MVLNDIQIKQATDKQSIQIKPFDQSSVEPASYDLHVGLFGITSKQREKRNIQEKGFIEIEAGDFALLLTKEVITLDLCHAARFGLRSKFARDGLVATVGTQIDPGFHGCLKVGLVNMSTNPIVLSYNDRFLTVEFYRLDQPASKGYSGPYQNQMDLEASDYEQMAVKGKYAFSEAFEHLKILTGNVAELTKDVSQLSRDISTMNNRIDGKRGNLIAWVAILIATIFSTASLVTMWLS